MKGIIKFLLIISFTLLLFTNFFLFLLIENKELSINKIKKDYQKLEENYENCIEKLNELELIKSNLESNYSLCLKELEEKKSENSLIKSNYSSCLKELKETKLQNSLCDFLNKKSKYEDFLAKNKIPEEIIELVKKYCIVSKTLNFGCTVYLLSDELNLNYKNEKEDNLLNVSDFLKLKGGDCEDWSFFFMVLVKEIMERENIKYLKYLIKEEGEKVNLYEKNNVIYYLENHSYSEKEIFNLYPSVICYEINDTYGHCQLAFLNKIFPSEDIEGFVVEPQTGEYDGKIVFENNEIYKIYKKEKFRVYIIMNQQKIFNKHWGFWLND